MNEDTSTETAAVNEAKTPKHRSPSYPAIDLKTAVGRTRAIQKLGGTHPAPMAAVIKEWGYGAKSSNGILTVAALKKYGLSSDSGKGDTRKLQLTRLGQEILFFGEDTEEWLERIRIAALTPGIYKELWGQYGPKLPDDTVMQHDLFFERGFSEAAAKDVLRQFRATVAYAKLAAAGGMVDHDELKDDLPDEGEDGDGFVSVSSTEPDFSPPPPSEPQGPPPPIQIRVQGKTVVVRESQALTGRQWDSMLEILKMLRPDD
jgi:hypothetical protein